MSQPIAIGDNIADKEILRKYLTKVIATEVALSITSNELLEDEELKEK